MKKFLKIILLGVFCFNLIGCSSSSKPTNMSEASYNTAITILELTDNYLDGKTEKEEFEASLVSLLDKIVGSEIGDIRVKTRAEQIKFSLSADDSRVKKSKEKLAEALEK